MKDNKKKEKQKILEPIKDEKTKHQLIYGITGPPKLSPKILTVIYNENRKD